MPEPNRRTAFSTLWAMDAMNPSQSTFHQSSQPRLCPPQPVQRRKDSLDYGPTVRHFPPIGGSLVPSLGLKVAGNRW